MTDPVPTAKSSKNPEAGANAEGTDAVMPLPEFQGRRELRTQIKMLFPRNIEDSHRQYIYERDEIGNHVVNRYGGDVFNKWCEVESLENPKIITEHEELQDRLKLKFWFRLAYIYAKVYGYSLIAYNWIDNAESVMKEPENISGLDSIRAIPKTHIEKIYYDENKQSKTYGDIIAYNIISVIDGKEEITRIPASRFLHITNMGIDGSALGLSIFDPVYDKLLIKKNTDYALGETVWKNASMLDHLELPEEAKPEHFTWATENFKDINVKSEFVTPFGFKIHRLDSNKNLRPREYVDYLLNTIGSGLRMGRTVLIGAQAGSLAGSEFNMKDYHGVISNEQTEFVEPIIYRPFFNRMLAENITKEKGNYTLNWNPLFEMDAKDVAEIENKNATTAQAIAKTLLDLDGIGYPVEVQDGKAYVRLPDSTQGILLEGLQTRDLSPQTTQSINRVLLTEEEKRRINNVWGLDYDAVEPKFTSELTSATLAYQEKYMDIFTKIWDASGLDQQTARNDLKELILETTKIKIPTANIQRVLEEFLEDSYVEGWEQTEKALEAMGIMPFPIDMPLVDRWIEVQAPMLRADITNDINNKFLRGIRDGISKGEGYDQINRRLRGITKEYQKGIPATVHKIVHEAMNRSRIEQLKKEGMKKVVWSSVGDARVRPEHRIDGYEFDIDDSTYQDLLSEFGCRCTIVPRTAIDAMRAET